MVTSIPENSRQFPRNEKIVLNKQFLDKLYGYLQVISYRDENTDARRYLTKKQINYSALARETKISRPSIKKYIDYMLDHEKGLGIMTYDETKEIYYLEIFPSAEAILIEKDLLSYLSLVFSKHTITIYSYLFMRWYAVIKNGGSSFEFMLDRLKDISGYSINSNSNDEPLKMILATMKAVGLINYTVRKEKNGNMEKHYYTILNVANKLSEIECLNEDALKEKVRAMAS